MNEIINKVKCFSILVSLFLAGCSSSNVDGLSVGKVSNSECLRNSSTRAADYSEPPTTLRLTREGNKIVAELVNYYLNCIHYDIIVNCKQEGSELNISVSEKLPEGNVLQTNCLCPVNIYFTIYDVEGDLFHVKVNNVDYGNVSFRDSNIVELTQ